MYKRQLRDVNADFFRGRIHVIVGPSGSGKTTLFGALSGLYRYQGSARLEGTLRAFRDPVFDRLRGELEALARDVAAGSGCRLDLSFSDGYPAVWNPPELLERVEGIWPLARLDKPVLITEDFSWYQRYLPGLFFFLGCGPAPALHSPDFQFDEGVLARGADLFTRIGEELV